MTWKWFYDHNEPQTFPGPNDVIMAQNSGMSGVGLGGDTPAFAEENLASAHRHFLGLPGEASGHWQCHI